MEFLEGLFASGRVVLLILLLVALEGVILVLYRLRTGAGISVAGVLANLAAGAALLLATGSALTNDHWTVTASWLAAGLAAHVADLFVRWR